MKYDHLSKEELLAKVNEFERELKGYVNRVDQRYKVFFERNLAGIYRTRINGEVLDCNDAMAQILGYSNKEDLIGLNATSLYRNPEDRIVHLGKLEENRFVKNQRLSLKKKDGTIIWVSISTSEILNPITKKSEYFEGTMIDITELIKTQDKLMTSEENYKKMLDESPYGILIHFKGKIKYFNKRADEILGIDLKKLESVNNVFPDNIVGKKRGKKLGTEHFDRIEINAGNRIIHLDIFVKEVFFENKIMTEFSFVDIQDRIELEEEKIKTYVFKNLNDNLKKEIKEKEKVEKELMSSLDVNMKQSAKLEAIFENSSHIMWTIDREFRLTSFNHNFKDLFKNLYNILPKKLDNPMEDYEAMHKSVREKWRKAHIKTFEGESINFITETTNLKGEKVYLSIFLNPIKDKKGVIEASGIGHDITDKVIAELKLTESLKEKEVLIKEIHHRVKNNLQVISSIFNLQSAFTTEEKIKEILRESQNRIKSMAYIHESLYKSTELGKIDFEQYIKELGKNLIHSYTYNNNQVSLLSETENVVLDLDIAIPCGLIVNEIISNSLKHAFEAGQRGIIMVVLKNYKNKIKLRIADDGKGIEEDVFWKESNSLGVQLIQTLTEQIRGEIYIDGSNGTSIEIVFPKNE